MNKSLKNNKKYQMLSNWINEFKLNKNKILLVICKDLLLKTKYAKELVKEKDGYYLDFLNFLEENLSQIKIYKYNEDTFLEEIIQFSNSQDKMVLVDHVEPLFGTWEERNFSNLHRCLDLVMSSQIIVIFSYYIPKTLELIESERIMKIN